MSDLTPEQRARLVEVMARAWYARNRYCRPWEKASATSRAAFLAVVEAEIAAAERAGFRWEASE